MSIVAAPASSFIPAGMADAVCEGCGAAIVVYRQPESPVRCAACEAQAVATASQSFAAESALFELTATIRALRQGLAPFSGMTASERQEQLDALLLADGERPVAELSSDELIALVGDESTPFPRTLAASMEIDKRLKTMPTTPIGDGAPDAEERQQIETEDEEYHRELTMRREWAAADEHPLAGSTFDSDFYPAA